MIIQELRYPLSITVLSACLLLQGCSLPVNRFTSSTLDLYTPTSMGSYKAKPATVELGNQLFKRGKKRAAAETYYKAALDLASPQRERVILQAAEVSASLGDERSTKFYLKQIPRQALVGESRARYQYTLALLALQHDQANQALRLLPLKASMTPGLRNKVLLVRQRALEMGGLLNNGQPYVPPEIRAQVVPEATRAQSVLPKAANNLAVLLPESGALGAVSKEIYQGMQDASGQLGATNTQFYATTSSNVLSKYAQAAEAGSDLIVGPLDKDALDVLVANSERLSVPILSLNYTTDKSSSPILYQFGLSPEDEAQQIAGVASNRGIRQAIVIVPDSQWGSRLANAFTQAYQAAGGQVVDTVSYPNSATKSYKDIIQNALGQTGDAQMIFLGASPTQARLLKPLIQARVADLPIYATSHIFSGKIERTKDADLDGIIYTDVPFILESIQQGSLETLKYPRLYALGMDAVLVAKNLPNLLNSQQIRGRTGVISLGEGRMLQRHLSMATFKDGLPIPLD